MRNILILTSIALIAACCVRLSPLQGNSSRFNGVWQGTCGQYHTSWTVKLTIRDHLYRIDYPSLACGGKLTLLSSSPKKLEFQEQLEYGESNCRDNGRVKLLLLNDTTAKYFWYSPNGNPAATGTLKIKKPLSVRL